MTTMEEVYDLALLQLDDYVINEQSVDSPSNFALRMSGYTILATEDFNLGLSSDLKIAYDDTTYIYDKELTQVEKVILADYVKLRWLSQNIANVTQFAMHLQTSEFKTYSEAQSLTAKRLLYNDLLQECKNKKANYELDMWDGVM